MNPQSIKAINALQIDQFSNFLKMSIPKEGWRVTFAPWKEKRSLDQNAFQHVIYGELSTYLITKGRTDCTPDWVRNALKNKFLGWEPREFTDIVTGEKRGREVLRSTAALDKGEACHYITQIIEWASSIGYEVKIPAKCEYRDMLNKQNE